MNTQILKKLQYALKHENYLICIPTTQFYNEKSKRFVKVFHIKHYKEKLYSSSSLIKIIKFTSNLLQVVKEANRTEELVELQDRDTFIKQTMEHYIQEEEKDGTQV